MSIPYIWFNEETVKIIPELSPNTPPSLILVGESPKRVTGKQCRPRSGSTLFAMKTGISIKHTRVSQ